MNKFAIILCGGKGTRLWPLSTSNKPKQFINIVDDNSLIYNTIKRIPSDYKKIFVSNIKFVNEINKYIDDDSLVIYEPIGKNTGQAIYIACKIIKEKYCMDTDAKIVVLPCDHIFDDNKFRELLGLSELYLNKVIAFGIKPTYAESGYGYIKRNVDGVTIDRFIEKPAKEVAVELINDGCLWNSGLFMFELDNILNIYGDLNKESNEFCNKAIENSVVDKNSYILGQEYSGAVNISFDYLIMEKIRDAIIIEYDGLWSDVGDWKRLWDMFMDITPSDSANNKLVGKDIDAIKTDKSFIYSDSGKIVTVGITDLIIVKFNDNVLILHKDNSDEFKKYIQM